MEANLQLFFYYSKVRQALPLSKQHLSMGSRCYSYTFAERGFRFLQEYEPTPMMSHDPTALKGFLWEISVWQLHGQLHHVYYCDYRIDVSRAAPIALQF